MTIARSYNNLLAQPLLPKTPHLLAHTTKRKPQAIRIAGHARIGGLMVFAPSGWGKSRLLGRRICYQHGLQGIGTVVFDVVGGTINNYLDKILYLPTADQLLIGDRLRYCNMAGEPVGLNDRLITTWPLLYQRHVTDTLFTTSQMPVDLIAQTDKNLASASIQGMNRLAPQLTAVGMVLLALNEPLSSVFDLLEGTPAWKTKLTTLARKNHEAREAALFLLRLLTGDDRNREEKTDVLKNKLFQVLLDPVSRAMYSARTPSIDWEEVTEKGLQVLIDFSTPQPRKVREWQLFVVWNSLMDYIQSRGSAGHEYKPLAVCVDELSYFVNSNSLNTDEIIQEFREFVQVRRRNANIWLIAATQELSELPKTMQQACLSIGSQLYGATRDFETALSLAKRWYYNDASPYKVKHWRTVWGSDGYRGVGRDKYFPIDSEPEFMPLEEQYHELSKKFRNLKKGQFLAALSPGEGQLPTHLRYVSTRDLDPGQYESQNKPKLDRLRSHLMQRDGVLVSDVLADIEQTNEREVEHQLSELVGTGEPSISRKATEVVDDEPAPYKPPTNPLSRRRKTL